MLQQMESECVARQKVLDLREIRDSEEKKNEWKKKKIIDTTTAVTVKQTESVCQSKKPNCLQKALQRKLQRRHLPRK